MLFARHGSHLKFSQYSLILQSLQPPDTPKLVPGVGKGDTCLRPNTALLNATEKQGGLEHYLPKYSLYKSTRSQPEVTFTGKLPPDRFLKPVF